MSESIAMPLDGGTMTLLVERPDSTPAPAVLVLHEVFGVNDDMRATCQELAARGFLAICPDLYWRIAPGFNLSRWSEDDLPRINNLYRAFDRDRAVQDIAALLSFSRGMAGASGKSGLLGYCMGGLLALLTAARHGADASVAYYPGEADLYLSEAPGGRTPLLIHLGEQDEYISPGARRAIRDAFADHASVQTFSYPGCSHAFARLSGDHYDAPAAALANSRSWTFLEASLR